MASPNKKPRATSFPGLSLSLFKVYLEEWSYSRDRNHVFYTRTKIQHGHTQENVAGKCPMDAVEAKRALFCAIILFNSRK